MKHIKIFRGGGGGGELLVLVEDSKVCVWLFFFSSNLIPFLSSYLFVKAAKEINLYK